MFLQRGDSFAANWRQIIGIVLPREGNTGGKDEAEYMTKSAAGVRTGMRQARGLAAAVVVRA